MSEEKTPPVSVQVFEQIQRLDESPDDAAAFEALKAALQTGNGAQGASPDDAIKVIERARTAHANSGNLQAAAWLIELEAPLVSDDPELQVALLKELARLKHEELLDDRGAEAAYGEALAINDDETVREAMERVAQAKTNWQQISGRFEGEASQCTDASLRTTLLTRAASLVWQHCDTEERVHHTDRLFREALEADPSSVRAVRLYQQILRSQGRYDELYDVLHRAGEHARARDERIKLQLQAARVAKEHLNDRDKAVAGYHAVVSAHPNHKEALDFCVQYHTENESWDELSKLYERAFRATTHRDDQRDIALQVATILWKRLGALGRAERYFQHLRKVDPANPAVVDFFREFLKDRPRELLDVLSEFLHRQNTDDRRCQLAREIAELAEQQPSTMGRAVDAWKVVERTDPEAAPLARESLARVYRTTGHWNALAELLRKRVDNDENVSTEQRIEWLREMASIYQDQLNLGAMVVQTHQKILALAPQEKASVHALANAFEAAGRWKDLIVVTERLVGFTDDSAECAEYLQRVAKLWVRHFANYAKAADALSRAFHLDPGNTTILGDLESMYERQRNWEGLYRLLSERVRQPLQIEETVALRRKLAELASVRLRNTTEALQHWGWLLEQDPSDPEVVRRTLELAEQEQNGERLASALRAAAAAAPEPQRRVKFLSRLAGVLADVLADGPASVRAWQEVLQIDPYHGEAMDALTRIFMDAQRWNELKELHQRHGRWQLWVDTIQRVAQGAVEFRLDEQLRRHLYMDAARVCEDELQKPELAVQFHESIVNMNLGPDASIDDALRSAYEHSLDALIAHYERASLWPQALAHRERRLDVASLSPEERAHGLAELARISQQTATHTDKGFRWAIEALEVLPSDGSLRELCRDLATTQEHKESLSVLLQRSLADAQDAHDEQQIRSTLADLALQSDDHNAAIEHLLPLFDRGTLGPDERETLERLLQLEERHGDLIRVWQGHLEAVSDPLDRCGWHLKIARLHEESLNHPLDAAPHYEEILHLAPEDASALQALGRIYGSTEQYHELARVVSRRVEVSKSQGERTDQLLRLASLRARHLDNPAGALDAYTALADAETLDDRAIEGLEWMEQRYPEYTGEVSSLLERAYETNKSHNKLLEVLERRNRELGDFDRRQNLLRMADIAERSLRDQERAEHVLFEALRIDPDDAGLWEQILTLRDPAEQSHHVRDLAEELLLGDSLPDSLHEDLTARLCRLFEQTGEPDRAIGIHRRALHLRPNDRAAFAALRTHFTQTEQWDELQKMYRNRVASLADPAERAALLLEVAFLFEELLQDEDTAMRMYEEALENDPRSAPARMALEKLYRRHRRWHELVGVWEGRLNFAEGPERIDLLFELGALLADKLERHEDAVGRFTEVLENNSSHVRAQERLETLLAHPTLGSRVASVLEPLYRAQGASRELAHALRIRAEHEEDPGFERAMKHEAAQIHLRRLAQPDEALALLAENLESDPSDGGALELFITAAHATSPIKHAEAAHELAGHLPPDHPTRNALLLDLGTTALQQVSRGECPDSVVMVAVDALETLTAPSVDPQARERAIFSLCDLYGALHRTQDLARVLRMRIDFEPEADARDATLRQLAECWISLGDVQAAAAVLRERLDIDPHNHVVFTELEDLLSAHNLWQDLIGVLKFREECSQDGTERLQIVLRVADTYSGRMEDNQSSIMVLDDAVDEFGLHEDVVSRLTWLYKEEKQWNRLVELLERSIEETFEPITRLKLCYQVAEVTRKEIRDDARSIDHFVRVLDLAPDHALARARLFEISRESEDPESRVLAAEQLIPLYPEDTEPDTVLQLLTVVGEHAKTERAHRAWSRASMIAEQIMGEPSQAMDFAARAAEHMNDDVDPEWAVRFERLAQVTEQWERFAESIERACRSPHLHREDQRCNLWRSAALTKVHHLNDPLGAAELFEQVRASEPFDRETLEGLQSLYERLERPRELVSVLEAQLETDLSHEERLDLLTKLGGNCLAQEDTERALAAYREILDMDPDNTAALLALESIFDSLERWDDLSDILRRQIEVALDQTGQTQYRLAEVLSAKMGRTVDAVECLQENLTNHPNHGESIAMLEGFMRDPAHRLMAAQALEPVYLQRLDWNGVTRVLSVQAEDETDPSRRAETAERLAQIQEEYLQDLNAAMHTYLGLFHEDTLEQRWWEKLDRLARHLNIEQDLAESFSKALEAIPTRDAGTAGLEACTARLFEQVGDKERAKTHFLSAFESNPTDDTVFAALQRLCADVVREDPESLASIYRARLDVVVDPADRANVLRQLLLVEHARSRWDEVLELGQEWLYAEASLEATGADGSHRERARDEVVNMVIDGMTHLERWDEVVDTLRNFDLDQRPDRKLQLATVLFERTGQQYDAVDLVRTLLTRSQYQSEATALLLRVSEEGEEDARAEALRALYDHHRTANRWREVLTVGLSLERVEVDEESRVELLIALMGVAEARLRDPQQALDVGARALTLRPRDTVLRSGVFKLAAKTSSWSRVTDALQDAINTLSPSDPCADLWAEVAALRERHLDQPKLAAQAYEKVVEIEPHNTDALWALEGLHTLNGDWEPLTVCVTALRDLSTDPAERANLSRRIATVFEKRLSDHENAIGAYEQTLEDEPRDEVSFDALRRLLTEREHFERWSDRIQDRLPWVDGPDLIMLHQELFRLRRERLQDRDGALDSARQALDMNPTDESFVKEFQQTLERWELFDELAGFHGEQAGRGVQPAQNRVEAARVRLHRLRDPEGALDEVIEALHADPEYAPAHDMLESLVEPESTRERAMEEINERWSVQGKWDELRAALWKYVQIVRSGDDAHSLELVRWLERLGELIDSHPGASEQADPAEAVKVWSTALQCEPERPEFLDRLDAAVERAHRWSDYGDLMLTLATKHQDDGAPFWRRAAVAAERLGRPERARDAYKRASELDIDVELLSHLERLERELENWPGVVDAIERRAQLSTDVELVPLLVEAARIQREQLNDADAGEQTLLRAMEHEPHLPGDTSEPLSRATGALVSRALQQDLRDETHERLTERLRGEGRVNVLRGVVLSKLRRMDQPLSDERMLEDAWSLAQQAPAHDDFAQVAVLWVAADVSDEGRWEEVESMTAERGAWTELGAAFDGLLDGATAPAAVKDPDTKALLSAHRAKVHGFLGHWPDAVRILERAIQFKPHETRLLEARARACKSLEQNETWVEATCAWCVAESNPDLWSDALQEAATFALEDLKNPPLAMRCYELWLDRDPEEPRAIAGAAIAYSQAEKWILAIPLLERWAELENDAMRRAELHAQTADAYLATQNAEAAIQSRARALEELTVLRAGGDGHAAAAFDQVQLRLEQELSEAGRWDEVVELLSNDDEVREARLQRAVKVCLTELQDPQRALDILERVVEVNPVALSQIAHIHQSRQDTDRSVDTWHRMAATQSVTLRKEGTLRLADHYAAQGDLRDAMEILQPLRQSFASDADVMLMTAELQLRTGDPHGALQTLEPLLQRQDLSRDAQVSVQTLLGRAHLDRGDPSQALPILQNAHRSAPSNVIIAAHLARAAVAAGDDSTAMHVLRALLLRDLKDSDGLTKAEVYFQLGQVLLRQNNTPKAVAMLRKSLAEQPDHAGASQLLNQLG